MSSTRMVCSRQLRMAFVISVARRSPLPRRRRSPAEMHEVEGGAAGRVNRANQQPLLAMQYTMPCAAVQMSRLGSSAAAAGTCRQHKLLGRASAASGALGTMPATRGGSNSSSIRFPAVILALQTTHTCAKGRHGILALDEAPLLVLLAARLQRFGAKHSRQHLQRCGRSAAAVWAPDAAAE